MDRKLKISFNSPIILGFVILSFIVYLADNLTGGFSTRLLFSVYRSSFIDPFTYFRFFGHVLGHANLDHFLGNIMLILVIGPMLEEKYGSANILFVILATALVTGLVHFFVFPHVYLLGASGVVFAFILLIFCRIQRRQDSFHIYCGCTFIYRAAGISGSLCTGQYLKSYSYTWRHSRCGTWIYYE